MEKQQVQSVVVTKFLKYLLMKMFEVTSFFFNFLKKIFFLCNTPALSSTSLLFSFLIEKAILLPKHSHIVDQHFEMLLLLCGNIN